MAQIDEREEELSTLSAIYPELSIDADDSFTASLELPVKPVKPLLIRFIPTLRTPASVLGLDGRIVQEEPAAYIERDVEFAHLPPLSLRLTLPNDYPGDQPPAVQLSVMYDWLPRAKLEEMERMVQDLWNDYGRCQILFAYISYLQDAIDNSFDLDQSADGCLVLSASQEAELVKYDVETSQAIFNANTFDCGICLEPKKGSLCYLLKDCGHVFCRSCLQDFYNTAISEGDVTNVKCLSPEKHVSRRPGKKAPRTLRPRELLDMGIEDSMVRRFLEMKRKKKLEADKSTVFCPRTWCQGAARSAKYPPIPKDLAAYDDLESSDDETAISTANGSDSDPRKTKNTKNIPPNPADRLAICEKCTFAFCIVCFAGWHGPFARCYPRDPSELSVEEKASYDYIRLHTSPCPYCSSPTQKTMGCNHMKCFQCNTHFCYLCGSWLDGNNPYQHFNKLGSGCYQRLWELEEGDEGQAPGDGRGFAGARAWEAMAIEAAREAEAREAAEAAQADEDARTARAREGHRDVPIEVVMAQIRLNEI